MYIFGKILLYKSSEGNGLLLTQDNEKFPFEIDVWNDFDHMPDAGMMVDVQLINGKVVSLKKSNQEAKSTSSSEVQDETSKSEKETPKPPAKLGNLEEYSVRSVAKGTMDKTLDSFFEDLTNTVAKFQEDSSTEEKYQVDYFAIKRFLFSAYNMLKDKDAKLVDFALVKILDNLNEISKVYAMYKKSKNQPKVAFEKIFLKYTKYKEAKERLEHNIEEMGKLGASADKLEKEIKNKSKWIKITKKDDPKLPDAVTSLRKMKRLYVDTIDEIGSRREENERLVPLTKEYFDCFFDDFIMKFNKSYDENMHTLRQILNSLAFVFDQSMWERAKQSNIIRHYFQESNIQGDFSTLTFLNYYLRSLDHGKLSGEQRSLVKLKHYLEKKETSFTSESV